MRVVLSGEETVVGINCKVCPGVGIPAKVAFLSGASVAQLDQLKENGAGGVFRVHLTQGSLLAVPPGFMCLSLAGADGSEGVRWGWWQYPSSVVARAAVRRSRSCRAVRGGRSTAKVLRTGFY